MDAQLLLALQEVRSEFDKREKAPVEAETYSVSEMCIVLGISMTSGYRLITRGFFSPLAGLRHLKIPRKQVKAYLDEQQTPAKSETS